jgi:fatty-acid desaturase
MYRHEPWMATVAYYVGVAALVFGYMNGNLMPVWIAAIYLAGATTLSVGYHRLFCHRAFKTSRVWHYIFAFYGVLMMYSSPLQWGVTHAAHHQHSDTDLDPHIGALDWRSLLLKGYRPVPVATFRVRKMMRDPLHGFIDRYYAMLWVFAFSAMAAISWDFTVGAYLPALGLAHLVAALHQTLSHIGNKPNDFGLLEFVLPSSGEWLHKAHHDKAGRPNFDSKWWHLDTGAWVIRLIRSA